MTDPSIIIPFRASDSHRILNLLSVVSHFRELFPDAQVLIAEHDASSKISDLPQLQSCELLHIQENGPFSKSRLINAAVDCAKSDLLFVCDADMIVGESGLKSTFDVVAGDYDFGRPYQWLIDLDLDQTQNYSDGGPLPDEPKEGESTNRSHLGECLCLAGGAFAIKKKVFYEVGGFDERFSGWGGEDNAFVLSLRRHNKNIGVLRDGIAWHLWHPRAKVGETGFHGNNLELLDELFEQANLPDSRPTD